MENKEKEIYFKVLSKERELFTSFSHVTEGKIYKGYYLEGGFIRFTNDSGIFECFSTANRVGQYELVDAPTEDKVVNKFKPGDRVRTTMFGLGTVVKYEKGWGSRAMVVLEMDDGTAGNQWPGCWGVSEEDCTLLKYSSSPRYHRPRVKPPELKRNKLVITYLGPLYSQYTLKDVVSAVVKAEVVSITYKKVVAGYESRINIDIPTKDLSSLEYKTPKGKTLLLFKEGVTYSATNKTIQL